MKPKLFLSYSWKDRQVAMRLHDDLSRSNITIWRDQVDGNPIADFEQEFMQEIDRCDYFIMLDSINYRKKSKWCYREVERCIDNKEREHRPQIIVCLLEPDGEWRTTYKDEKERRVFEKVNRLKYHSLFYVGYDDNNEYDATVNFICELLGTSYERWDRIPSYQDLMDEMNTKYHQSPFDDTIANIILGEYKNIILKIEKHFSTVEESFRIWIKDCETNMFSPFFPKWTFAIWQMNQDSFDKSEVLKLLYEITRDFPDDPRGYRALGCFSAYLGNCVDCEKVMMSGTYYTDAKSALLKAKELLERPENYRQKSICYFEVLTNLGKVYSILKDNSSSITYWGKALVIMKKEGFFYESLVSDFFIELMKQDYPATKMVALLSSLLDQYPLESILYQLLGLLFCHSGETIKAYPMIEKAYSLNPCAENLYYLVNIRAALGKTNFDDVIKLCNNGNWDDNEIVWIDEIYNTIR